MADGSADERLAEALANHGARLQAFVRRNVPDAADAEDIVQESFYELWLAYRLLQPVERVAAWLARVARNRIVDRARRRERRATDLDSDAPRLLDLPAPRGDRPDEAHAQAVLGEVLEAALAELPAAQREVFIAHELEGESFRAMAARTGTPLNTLLGRKHAAVTRLRERLQAIYEDFEEDGT
jgi:RNA polymerase sigma factor (sigma-70 family)